MSYTDQQFSAIQYKTGVNGGSTVGKSAIESLDKLLQTETKINGADSWSKLDKTTRIRKLKTYVKTKLIAAHNLTAGEADKCLRYMVRNMDRQLRRVRDVTYDKSTGEILDIPAFAFNAKSRAFTMKRESDSPGTRPTKKSVQSVQSVQSQKSVQSHRNAQNTDKESETTQGC
jgi:hypothetical protein